MSITVRRLGPDDWRAFRDMRLQALTESPGAFFAPLAAAQAWPDERWQMMVADPNAAVFGAFDGEVIVGITAVFTEERDPSGATAGMGMTWLAPGYRGRGVSRIFYAARIAWAKAHGHRLIEVGHRASNAASGAAMRRAGFRLVRTEPRRWPDGAEEDLLCYEMELTPNRH